MKKIALHILFLLLTSQFVMAQCHPNSNNIYEFTNNGSRYEIIKEKLSWADAASCAALRGGKLVEINSKTEQDTLFNHVNNAGILASNTIAPDGGGASYLWIGANDLATEGNWIWDGDNKGSSILFWKGVYPTGMKVGGLYNNWGDEPDNFGGTQNGLGLAITNWPLGIAGQWNDINTTNLLYYIIEYATTSSVSAIHSNPFSIYPNPINDLLIIHSNDAIKINKIEIFDLTGKQIKDFCFTNYSDKINIDLSDMKEGVYVVKVLANELSKTFKIIKIK